MKRFWVFLFFAAVVGAAAWVLRAELSLDSLIQHENSLRRLVTDYPIIALGVGLVVYVTASLVPGTLGKAIVCGWLFGFWKGLLIVNCGLTVAAVIVFFAIRYLFFRWVHRKLPHIISHIDRALLREGGFYLLTLRLLHAPYTLTNYAAGATAVPARTFWWTSQLGMLPGNIAFVLAGAQIPTLRRLAQQGPWSLVNVPLLLGLSLTALVPIAIRWRLRHLRPDAQRWQQEPPAASTPGRKEAG